MKYFAYKKKWKENEGFHPCQYLFSIGTVAEPAFDEGGLNEEDCYGYLISGEFDEYSITEWNIREISKEQMLEAAKQIEDSAYFDNNRIFWVSNGGIKAYG